MNDQSPRSGGMPPIGCNLAEPARSARRIAISDDLFRQVEEVQELDDGFAYRDPAAEAWAGKLPDFIAAERRCRPFFTFDLAFEPNDGPLWLRLRDAAEIKAIIRDGLIGSTEPLSPA